MSTKMILKTSKQAKHNDDDNICPECEHKELIGTCSVRQIKTGLVRRKRVKSIEYECTKCGCVWIVLN